MQTHTHNHQHAKTSTPQTGAPSKFAVRLEQTLGHAWQVLRAVLRGYCAGQPCHDGRPRKGCC